MPVEQTQPSRIDAGAGTSEGSGEPPSMNAFLRGTARAARERRGELVTLAAQEERRSRSV
jgi:hypothetical protein